MGDAAHARRHVEAPFERHVERLDACSEGRKEVQDIARAREAAASVAPMQIGAMKGTCVKNQGTCVQHWHLNDENFMVKAR